MALNVDSIAPMSWEGYVDRPRLSRWCLKRMLQPEFDTVEGFTMARRAGDSENRPLGAIVVDGRK